MGGFRCSSASDLAVCCVWADLNVLGPSDLPEAANVNRAEERLISEWRENPTPDIP